MGLRRVPKDLRRALSTEVKEQVAVPLAGRIRVAASGPYTRVLSAGTKARAGADPTIVVGGLSPKLKGGGGPRSVVFGTEWGGGKRSRPITGYTRGGQRPGRVRGHRRHTTMQFGRPRPFVYSTVSANYGDIIDTYADIVMRVLGDGVE